MSAVVESLVQLWSISGGDQREVSVVVAGFIGGRDGAVEERRGSCEAKRSFHTAGLFLFPFSHFGSRCKVSAGFRGARSQLRDRQKSDLSG